MMPVSIQNFENAKQKTNAMVFGCKCKQKRVMRPLSKL